MIKVDQTKQPIAISRKPAIDVENTKYIPKPYKEVAQSMEMQFAQHMIEQMNNTVEKEEEDGAGQNASEFYQSLETQERAKTMSEHKNGLGIQKVILDQVYPKRLRNEMAYNAYLAQEQRNMVKPNRQEVIQPLNSPKGGAE